MRALLALPVAIGLALAGCAGQPVRPPAETAVLPPDAIQGAGDPVRSAITASSTAFAMPNRMAGQPAVAARAIANMEFLTADLPGDPRYTGSDPNVVTELRIARQEWRATLGIPPEAPAQAVINGLFAAARALDAGVDGAAALNPAVFTRGGAATLAMLGDLPPLPRTNDAAVLAGELLRRNEGLGTVRR